MGPEASLVEGLPFDRLPRRWAIVTGRATPDRPAPASLRQVSARHVEGTMARYETGAAGAFPCLTTERPGFGARDTKGPAERCETE